MSLVASTLQGIPISYASCSIGCKPEHTLPKRLEAIAAAGFTGIELSFPDIVAFAETYLKEKIAEDAWEDLVTVTKVIKAMCDAKSLQIMMLQPFANFEGWAEGSQERKEAFERADGWIRIMQAAGTDLLQARSSDTPAEKIGNDRGRFVKDLQLLADKLAEKNFRLAYENWCWSTHAPGWADVWDIVQKVDRSNVGLCLDTFQSAGGEWGDPTSPTALLPGKSEEEITRKWKASCNQLSQTIPADKIYLLQISDAYKPKEPFSKDVDDSGLRPRGRWSHDFRPLPYDGGYLPVADFARAVLKTGFRGWFSYEVFDGGPEGKGRSYELSDYALRARKAQDRLLQECLGGQ